MSFSGKVVVVTGASSGIGAAAAELFAREGARVALVARNEAKLARVAQRCAAHGAPPLVIRADLANEAEVNTIIKKTIDHFGQLDVLVNNAGILKLASVADPDILKVFDSVMNTNLRAAVQLTSLAAPHLAAVKGNIVNVSSVTARRVFQENYMPYSVSKIGLNHFTRCAAMDLAASGVRVNCVEPGPVRTNIHENCGVVAAGGEDAILEYARNSAALRRVAEPEEIADLIAFLASDKARSTTGSIFVSDCGVLLKKY